MISASAAEVCGNVAADPEKLLATEPPVGAPHPVLIGQVGDPSIVAVMALVFGSIDQVTPPPSDNCRPRAFERNALVSEMLTY